MNRIKMRNLLYLLTFVCTHLTSCITRPYCKSYYHTLCVTSQMGKRCKKLEKDGAQWKTKWEGANKALLDMAEDVSDVNLSYSFCLLKSYLFSSRLLFAKFKFPPPHWSGESYRFGHVCMFLAQNMCCA